MRTLLLTAAGLFLLTAPIAAQDTHRQDRQERSSDTREWHASATGCQPNDSAASKSSHDTVETNGTDGAAARALEEKRLTEHRDDERRNAPVACSFAAPPTNHSVR